LNFLLIAENFLNQLLIRDRRVRLAVEGEDILLAQLRLFDVGIAGDDRPEDFDTY
jgi:hypothetical protein